jgi:hypothetical protein
MKKLRVWVGYSGYQDGALSEQAGTVAGRMNGNPGFLKPPVPLVPPLTLTTAQGSSDTPVDLTTLRANFDAAVQAAADGGMTLTAAKNDARQALITALDMLAFYVQSVARFDVTLLLSSGFQPVSTNRAQVELPAPAIQSLENAGRGVLLMRVTPIVNARGYQVQIKSGSETWTDLGIFPQARRIELTALTTGTVYTTQVRAVGGLKLYSEWSDPSSHMAM